MNLGDFLNTAGSTPAAPQEPVSFEILHQTALGESHKIPCNAVLVCLPEKDRQKALAEALKHMRKQYPDGIPPERLAEEERYQILAEALRDSEEPRKSFAGVAQLRTALVSSVAHELWQQYVSFLEKEFPPIIDAVEFAKLVEDAKKKSFSDLLSSIGSVKLLRALPGLTYLFAGSQTQTSSDGEPA
jgi:hypothetical protein